MPQEEVTMMMSVVPGAMTGISTLMSGLVSVNNIFMDMTRQIDSSFGLIDSTIVTTGAVVAQLGFQAAQAFGEFEQGMKVVQMVSNQTASDMDFLKQKANEFSVSYRMDIDQITEGLQTLGRAGLNSASEQTEVLQEGLSTAKLESRDLNGVLEELIQNTALLGGNLKGSDFGESSKYVNDLLVATSMTAPITTHDVSETLKYSGGIAAAAGANIETEEGKRILEDYMGAIAAFAQKGVTGSIAGTALRAFFNKPATQDSSVTDALASIKLKPEYLWEDDEETMKPVSEQIDIITKQMDKLDVSTMDRLQIWSKIVGGKMGQQMMKLDSSTIKDITKDIQAADDAESLAAGTFQTFQANMKEMTEQGQVAFREFGSKVAYFLNPIIDVITKILEMLSNPAVMAGITAAFMSFIGLVYSKIKGIFTKLKGEFSDFVKYFKSGEELYSVKPSVIRGLERKSGGITDYSKTTVSKDVTSVKDLVNSYKSQAQADRLEYLRSQGLTDAQIAARGITSKWSSQKLVDGTPDSEIMKYLIDNNKLSKEEFNDIFVLSADEWRKKYQKNFGELIETLEEVNSEVEKTDEATKERLASYKAKRQEVREQAGINPEKTKADNEKYMEETFGVSPKSSISNPIIDNAKKANQARETYEKRIQENLEKVEESVEEEKTIEDDIVEGKTKLKEHVDNLIKKGEYEEAMRYIRAGYKDNLGGLPPQYYNWEKIVGDINTTQEQVPGLNKGVTRPVFSENPIIPDMSEIPEEHLIINSPEYNAVVDSIKKAHESTKEVNTAVEEYFSLLNNELQAFAMDLKNPGYKESQIKSQAFDDFYEKNKSKKLGQMGIPVTKQDKVLLSPDVIKESFLEGLVPNISKEQFKNLPLSTGGIVADIFQNNKQLDSAYNNFTKLLENRLKEYLDFIAPPISKTQGTEKDSFKYISDPGELAEPAGPGRSGKWSANRIIDFMKDTYGIEDIDGLVLTSSLGKNNLANLVFPFMRDWSIPGNKKGGMTNQEFDEMAKQLGLDTTGMKNRQERIDALNKHLSGKLGIGAQNWLDDYNEIADSMKPPEPLAGQPELNALAKNVNKFREDAAKQVEELNKKRELNEKAEQTHKDLEKAMNVEGIDKELEELEHNLDEIYDTVKKQLNDLNNEIHAELNELSRKNKGKGYSGTKYDFVDEYEAMEDSVKKDMRGERQKNFNKKRSKQEREDMRKRIRDDLDKESKENMMLAMRGMAPRYGPSDDGPSDEKEDLLISGMSNKAVRDAMENGPDTIRNKLSNKLSGIGDSISAGISGFFANAKKRLTKNRPGRMLGYANATTKFQKLTNVVGNVTDLMGGPLMVAMEAFTIIMNYVNELYQEYQSDLKDLSSSVKEAYSDMSSAESGLKQSYRENNPDATNEDVENYILDVYSQRYEDFKSQAWLDKANITGDKQLTEYEYDEEKDDGSFKEKEEEEKTEEQAYKEAVDKNTGALYAATAQLQASMNSLVNKMQDGVWGVDGLSSVISDTLGGLQDHLFSWDGQGSGFIEEGGFLLTASQKDSNYQGYTEMAGLMLEDLRDSNGDLYQGMQTMLGKDAKDVLSSMSPQGKSLLQNLANFSANKEFIGADGKKYMGLSRAENLKMQQSMKMDKKSWQAAAKELAKVEMKKKSGKEVTGKDTRRLEGYIKKLATETGLSEIKIKQGLQLQQLQDMYSVAQQVMIPLAEQQAQIAAEHLVFGEATAGSTNSTSTGANDTAAIASVIASYVAVVAQAKSGEAYFEAQRQKGDPDALAAKDYNEYMSKGYGQNISLDNLASNVPGLGAIYSAGKTTGLTKWMLGDKYDEFNKFTSGTAFHLNAEHPERFYGQMLTLEAMGEKARNPSWTDEQAEANAKKKLSSYFGSTGQALYNEDVISKIVRENYAGAITPSLLNQYMGSDIGEVGDEGGGSGSGSGSGSGGKDKDQGTRKERVDLVLCNKKEIPKLNVNLFKKPPTFTVLNKNFKLRDVKINTEDKPKAIMASIKNAFIDVQKRSDPKIIQDEEAEYDPVAATDGNSLPSGSSKPRTNN